MGQGGKGCPYLDANSQRIKSICNICLSPELSSVNDVAFQRIKLYINQRMQLSEKRYGQMYDVRQTIDKM